MTFRAALAAVDDLSNDSLEALAALGWLSAAVFPAPGTGYLTHRTPVYDADSPAFLLLDVIADDDGRPAGWPVYEAGIAILLGLDDYIQMFTPPYPGPRDVPVRQSEVPFRERVAEFVTLCHNELDHFCKLPVEEWRDHPPADYEPEDLGGLARDLTAFEPAAFDLCTALVGTPYLLVHRASAVGAARPETLSAFAAITSGAEAFPDELLAAFDPWCDLLYGQRLILAWERQEGRELTAAERAERLWRAFAAIT